MIVANALNKKDTLAVMPTGSGKSICYQLPALVFSGLTVVVSPLISLMQDQVDQLLQNGINADFLNSTLDYQDYIRIINKIRAGEVRLLYAAPEILWKPETLHLFEQVTVDCLTIDEAHCISQWGHDFRPEYRKLITLLERLPQATCLAVTATATKRVRNDIKQTLHISEADEFVASFNRKNLFLAVNQRTGDSGQILDFLEDHKKEAGIIYCNTKREVNELVEELVALGWPVLPYHADLDNSLREQNQHRFIFEEGIIIIATIAFGMGIDKSNVRFILHTGLPKSLENYYHQIGRAGRDGLRADCLLLYSGQDIATIRYFIEQQDESQREGAWARVKAMLAYAETARCRRVPLLAYFGETFKEEPCGICDNWLENDNFEKVDLTIPAQKFLSCVFRTGQYFGKEHIIKVLRGSQAKSVLSRKHGKLSTYNIGREFSRNQWRELADQFLGLGLFEKDVRHGSLSLTIKGHEVLRGSSVFGHIPQIKPIKTYRRPHDDGQGYNSELFDWLRAKRSEIAQQANVPPYMIFSDFSLSEMAYYFPKSSEAFARINGVGNFKLEKYAHDFLEVIRAFCEDHDIPERPDLTRKNRRRKYRTTISPRTSAIIVAVNSGDPLQKIANDFAIKKRTVINHLWKFVQRGGRLDQSRLLAFSELSEDDCQKILRAMRELGVERLRPIYDYFEGSFNFDTLSIMRVYYLTSVITRGNVYAHENR
jgi:ATP-dependent DNA helicase RecQ